MLTTVDCIARFVWTTFRYAADVVVKYILTSLRNAGHAYGPSGRKDQIPNPRGFQVSNPVHTLKTRFQIVPRYIPYGELSEVRVQVLSDCE